MYTYIFAHIALVITLVELIAAVVSTNASPSVFAKNDESSQHEIQPQNQDKGKSENAHDNNPSSKDENKENGKKEEIAAIIPQTGPDEGDNRHPSGKDRSVEPGGSGTQGKSSSDPDGTSNSFGAGSGNDKQGFDGGFDKGDQDNNNGCGNDDDFEDDNNGRCLGRAHDKHIGGVDDAPTPSPTVGVTPTQALSPTPTLAPTASPTPTPSPTAGSTPTPTPTSNSSPQIGSGLTTSVLASTGGYLKEILGQVIQLVGSGIAVFGLYKMARKQNV